GLPGEITSTASRASGATPRTGSTCTVACPGNTSTCTWPKFATGTIIGTRTCNPCCTSFSSRSPSRNYVQFWSGKVRNYQKEKGPERALFDAMTGGERVGPGPQVQRGRHRGSAIAGH